MLHFCSIDGRSVMVNAQICKSRIILEESDGDYADFYGWISDYILLRIGKMIILELRLKNFEITLKRNMKN